MVVTRLNDHMPLKNTDGWSVYRITNSILESATYVAKNEILGLCWMVDCGDEKPVLELTDGLNLKYILLTHAHFDHIYGLNDILEAHRETPVVTNDIGKEMLLDERKNMSKYHDAPFVIAHPERVSVIENGSFVDLAEGLMMKAVFTPGHNPSCITWVSNNIIFTGDAYIPDLKTVSNLPGGNKHLATESVKRILEFAKGKIIYPGHKI